MHNFLNFLFGTISAISNGGGSSSSGGYCQHCNGETSEGEMFCSGRCSDAYGDLEAKFHEW